MTDVIHCSNCNANNPPEAQTCAFCGHPLVVTSEEDTWPGVASVLDVLPNVESPMELDGVDEPFPARMPGARYFRGRFQVVQYLGIHNLIHSYLVLDSDWALRCMNHNCRLFGVRQAGDQPGLCPECVTPLESFQPHVLLLEAASPDEFGTALAVIEREVNHPLLLAPLYYFEESDASAVRCCLALPAPPARYLSELSGTQDVVRVLRWGQRLARGLLALHHFKVVFNSVDADHVGFIDAGAVWVDFSAVKFLPSTAPLGTAEEDFNQDFVDLAALLWKNLTGQDEYDAAAPVSPRIKRLFSGWLSADESTPMPREWVEALASLSIQPFDSDQAIRSIDLRSGRATTVGLVRKINEDSLLVIEMAGIHRTQSRALGLYVVADGMGGHATGDVASGLAISTLARRAQADLFAEAVFTELTSDDIIAWLKRAVREVNEIIYERRQQTRSNLGTTLIMAVINGDQAFIANVGDSRAYLYSGEELAQITTDHSLIEQLIAARHVTPEEAQHHPQRSIIYKSLGERSEIEPDIELVSLEDNDSLLFCSDGLNSMIADEEIQKILISNTVPQEAADQLVAAADDAGGQDNITVLVVNVIPIE